MRTWRFPLALGAAVLVLTGGAGRVLAGAAAAPAAAESGGFSLANLGGLVVSLVGAVVSLAVSLTLSMWAVKKAIATFDGFTKGLDEQAELRKGNVAVGILLAAVIYSIATVIGGGVEGLTKAIRPEISWAVLIGIVVGAVNLLVGITVATYTVTFALKMLDRITKDLDEWQEIGKGNVAVAIVMAGVLLAVSSVVQIGVSGIGEILNAEKLARTLGF